MMTEDKTSWFYGDEGGNGGSCSSSPCCMGDEPRGSIVGIVSGVGLWCCCCGCWWWCTTTGIETDALFDRLGDCDCCCATVLPANEG